MRTGHPYSPQKKQEGKEGTGRYSSCDSGGLNKIWEFCHRHSARQDDEEEALGISDHAKPLFLSSPKGSSCITCNETCSIGRMWKIVPKPTEVSGIMDCSEHYSLMLKLIKRE